MNFQQIANKFQNSNEQDEANKNQRQRSSEKRKFNNDQPSAPPPAAPDYPNKKRRLAQNTPSYNYATDNDLWKQHTENFSVNNRLKTSPRFRESQNISTNPRSYSSDTNAQLPRWGQLNEQVENTKRKLNYDNNKSGGSGGYWDKPTNPDSYSANNRLKKLCATIQTKAGSDKAEASSESSVYQPNRNNFSNKPHTATCSSETDINNDFYQWRKESSQFSDNSEPHEPRNYVRTNSSSSLGSANSQKSKNAPAPKFNIQDRLTNIRNSHNSNKTFYSKNKQTTSYAGAIGGGWYKPIDVEQQPRSKIYNNNNRTYYNKDTLPSTSTAANRLKVENNTNFTNNNNRYLQSDYASSPGIQQNDSLNSSNSSPNVQSDEEMEWSYIDERELVSNLKDLRRTFNSTNVPQTRFQKIIARDALEIEHNKTIIKATYLVVDTNIFLSHLKLVEQIMAININGNTGVSEPIILVPWIVIQELDHIKDRPSDTNGRLRLFAQKAICFINKCLIAKRNLKGQSVRDAVQQDFITSNFDDGILHCCMQVRDRNNRAILLSNDVNLRNKLLTENIEAYGSRDILLKLDPFYCVLPDLNIVPSSTALEQVPRITSTPESNIKLVQIKARFSDLLNFILARETRIAFGDLCSRKALLKNTPPWSLAMCVNILEYYWQSVFYINLHRRCLSNVQALKDFIRNQATDIKKLVDLSLALCMDLRTGYKDYRDIIKDYTNWVENYDQ